MVSDQQQLETDLRRTYQAVDPDPGFVRSLQLRLMEARALEFQHAANPESISRPDHVFMLAAGVLGMAIAVFAGVRFIVLAIGSLGLLWQLFSQTRQRRAQRRLTISS